MNVLPVTSPSVLTEDLFETYGGSTGTSTAAQRNAAFCIAEQNAQVQLMTPLTPTSVSGTFHWFAYGQPMMLPYAHVHSIDEVVLVCEDCVGDCAVTDYTQCAHLKRPKEGIIELRIESSTVCGSCGCCGSPLMWRITYTAGLETGMAATAPAILHALTIAANIALEQIVDPGASEGGPGDPGVQEWASLDHRERRTKLKQTAFGSSARANYAANLLKPWKVKRALKLGW